MPLGVLKKYNALGNQDDWVLPGIRPDKDDIPNVMNACDAMMKYSLR
jgi:hypothetical protein